MGWHHEKMSILEFSPSIVIDARMIGHSGIGTYLQHLIPFFTRDFRVTLLGDPRQFELFSWRDQVRVVSCRCGILGIWEQIWLPIRIPRTDYFWSPQFNVPILPIRARFRIVTIHDVLHLAKAPQFGFAKRLYARLMIYLATRRSDHIFTVSYFSRSEVMRFLRVRHDKITAVQNAINPHMFYPISKQYFLSELVQKFHLPERFVLFVGNIKPHKNLISLIEAMRRVGEDISLVVVGKRSGFITGDAQIEALLASDDPVLPRLHFIEDISMMELAGIYNLAEVFVLPSLYEGFGLPPLEAMASGCPVVVSQFGSLPEVCGDAAMYCEAEDPDSIADAIQTVLDQPEVRDELIRKGLQRVKMFSWERAYAEMRYWLERLDTIS